MRTGQSRKRGGAEFLAKAVYPELWRIKPAVILSEAKNPENVPLRLVHWILRFARNDDSNRKGPGSLRGLCRAERKRIYVSEPSMSLQAWIRPCTDSTDLANIAWNERR